MFWGFLLLTGLAFVFVQLGALSVWVAVLKLGLMLGLMVALLALAVMGIVLLWRKMCCQAAKADKPSGQI